MIKTKTIAHMCDGPLKLSNALTIHSKCRKSSNETFEKSEKLHNFQSELFLRLLDMWFASMLIEKLYNSRV